MRKALLAIPVVLMMLLRLCGNTVDFESEKPSEQPNTTNATEYLETQPSDPVVSQPEMTEPVGTEYLETQPSDPAVSQPEMTEPVGTEYRGENETPNW